MAHTLLVHTGRILAVLVGLALLGAAFESISEAADARAYAPPGQLVDVGGYRLHINCVGTGSPTVVIESGWGDWSAAWSSWVQPQVASTTRVCTYDRAGYGFSEPGPLPRTADRFAQELHTLLHAAGIPGPYVLAGHSMGGLTVRLFAHDYAEDVAGVVLIESMSPSSAKPSDAQSDAASGGDWILRLPARIGLLRLLARPLGLSAAVSPELADGYAAASVTPRFVQTYLLDEGRGMPASLLQAGQVTTLGDVPLIVLSRGLDQEPEWTAQQAELLKLSSNSQQLFATHSGHNIEFDDPQAAVGAIAQMVDEVRREGRSHELQPQ